MARVAVATFDDGRPKHLGMAFPSVTYKAFFSPDMLTRVRSWRKDGDVLNPIFSIKKKKKKKKKKNVSKRKKIPVVGFAAMRANRAPIRKAMESLECPNSGKAHEEKKC